MAHLDDMEELLEEVCLPHVRDYMAESLASYMGGAYRGCIVLSYIALFDYLFQQLEQLAKVNKQAKQIYKEAFKKKEDQEPFENYLTEQLKSKTFISALDATFCNRIKDMRNKAAHPSGYKPSAEEARYVYAEVIRRVLSQPILGTDFIIEKILNRLENAHFFPTYTYDDLKAVVTKETSNLHDEAVKSLIHRLIAIQKTQKEYKNAYYFLVGLAALNKKSINQEIQTIVIQEKADDSNYASIITSLISVNGLIIDELEDIYLRRINALLLIAFDTAELTLESELHHPLSALGSIAKSASEEKLQSAFIAILEKAIEFKPTSYKLLEILNDKHGLIDFYLPTAYKHAGSHTFNTANAFASFLKENDEAIAHLLTNEQVFLLLTNLLNAARNNAIQSVEIRDSKFSLVPKLKEKFISFASNNSREASEITNNKLGEDFTLEVVVSRYFSDEE